MTIFRHRNFLHLNFFNDNYSEARRFLDGFYIPSNGLQAGIYLLFYNFSRGEFQGQRFSLIRIFRHFLSFRLILENYSIESEKI